MTEEQKELLPCPFCGNAPESHFMGNDDGGYWACYCGNCNGSETPFCGVHVDLQEDAERIWNTRHNTINPDTKLVERIKNFQLTRLSWAHGGIKQTDEAFSIIDDCLAALEKHNV